MSHCKKTRSSLWRYVDRELPARELSGISRHLRECSACRKLYEERAREAKVWRMSLTGSPFGEAFVGRFRKRFEKAGLNDLYAFEHGASRAFRPVSISRGERRRRLMVISLFLLIPTAVMMGVLLHQDRGLGTCRLEAGSESVTIRGRKGVEPRLVSRVGPSIYRPGESFQVPAGTTLGLTVERAGATTATLKIVGPAEFSVPPNATAVSFEGFLKRGSLSAEVADRASGERFAIETPYGNAVVVGTRFSLDVDADARETRLEVQEGVVAFRGLTEDEEEQVEIHVTRDTSPQVMPRRSHPSTDREEPALRTTVLPATSAGTSAVPAGPATPGGAADDPAPGTRRKPAGLDKPYPPQRPDRD